VTVLVLEIASEIHIDTAQQTANSLHVHSQVVDHVLLVESHGRLRISENDGVVSGRARLTFHAH
jgi:hypothetical protein